MIGIHVDCAGVIVERDGKLVCGFVIGVNNESPEPKHVEGCESVSAARYCGCWQKVKK